MHLRRGKLILLLIATLLPTLMASRYPLPLTFLAPLIVALYYRLPLIPTLWLSLGSGLFLDLLNTDPRFGLHAVTYTLTTLLLYPQKRHFFVENLSTLPILTALFAALSTVIRWIALAFFGRWVTPSLLWFFADIVFLPLLTGGYAFVAIALPSKLFKRPETES